VDGNIPECRYGLASESTVTMSNAAQKRAARKVRSAWSSRQRGFAQESEWMRLLSTVDPNDFMLPDERQKFDELPDLFTVYRSYQGNRRVGLCWTLNIEVAKNFSNQDTESTTVKIIHRRVRKSEIYALIDNDEQEIIILPRKFTHLSPLMYVRHRTA
jgi:hypothetical protein